MLKMFPTALVSWREPASYTYWRRKPFGLMKAAILFSITGIIFVRAQHTSWGTAGIFLLVAIGFTAAPWVHHRWPKLLPLSGPIVTLYEDRIARQGGKSQIYISLDNVAGCSYWNHSDPEGDFWVLRFEPKKNGWGRNFMGTLLETAIGDPQVFEQIVMKLRECGVTARETQEIAAPA